MPIPMNERTIYVRDNLAKTNRELLDDLLALGYEHTTMKEVAKIRYRVTKRKNASPEQGKEASEEEAADKPRRRSPKVPRAGSFSEFVTKLPFDTAPDVALAMGLEAGWDVSVAAVYAARRAYKHLRRRFAPGAGPELEKDSRLRADLIERGRARRESVDKTRQAGADKPTKKTHPVSNGSAQHAEVEHVGQRLSALTRVAKGDARQQLAALVMRLGLDEAEKVLAEFRAINSQLDG